MCSASWLTCSTRPDLLVDLYRIWLAGSWLMVTKKIAELDASDLERVARYKSTHTRWDVHVSGPLQAIRHLPNETQLTIGVAVVSISREYRQDETVVFDR